MTNKLNEIQWNQNIFDFIKKPIITVKTIKFIEQKKYVFDVNNQLTKKQIKQIFEQYFGIRIKSINTFRKDQKNKKSPKKRVIIRFFKQLLIPINV
uniref:Large ribosomal subunit protein uL23c n=1 Tax=Glaukea argentea TaxID=2894057 RepID=A0A386B1L6_9CHLO|nr:ribosomal protein L23 [Udotea argentea]AYC65599.1 ribosomal protein L23 [Udotea argentea]